MGKTIEALREAKFEVSVVGFGYPPIYVEAEEEDIDLVQEVSHRVDPNTTFTHYRTDIPEIMSVGEWASYIDSTYVEREILWKAFSAAEFTSLCEDLDIPKITLDGNVTGDIPLMASSLVSQCKRNNRWSDLVIAVHKLKTNLFEPDSLKLTYLNTLS